MVEVDGTFEEPLLVQVDDTLELHIIVIIIIIIIILFIIILIIIISLHFSYLYFDTTWFHSALGDESFRRCYNQTQSEV